MLFFVLAALGLSVSALAIAGMIEARSGVKRLLDQLDYEQSRRGNAEAMTMSLLSLGTSCSQDRGDSPAPDFAESSSSALAPHVR